MIDRKPSKVEELLSTLQLYHLLPTTSSSPQNYSSKPIRLAWSAPNQYPTAITSVVKPKFTKPLRRRLQDKHNESFAGEFPMQDPMLVTVKPDRIAKIKKVSVPDESCNTGWTPRVEQKELELETTVPLHKRRCANRAAFSSFSKSRPLQFIHFYRHIQLSSIEKPGTKMSRQPANTPEQVLACSYDPPYSQPAKGKTRTRKGYRVGYELPKVRKVSEEIVRLQKEKDRKFDAIIADVMKEFNLTVG